MLDDAELRAALATLGEPADDPVGALDMARTCSPARWKPRAA